MTDDESRRKRIEEEIIVGDDAQKLLNNKMIQGFLVSMKADLMTKFGMTEASQSDVRDEIWRMTKVVNQFEDSLRYYMENGTLAREELKEMDSEI